MKPKRYIIPVFVPHLGCPNNCVFCNQRRISGAQTPANAQTVLNAVEASRKINPDASKCELAFYGGSFTAIPEVAQRELLEAAGEFVNAGGVIRISTRPDCITEDILKHLKNAGVKTIELGCQSMDGEVLELSGRGHTAEDAEKSAKLIKKYGFDLILQMMTGLPGDTMGKSLCTAKRLAALQPDGVRVYPTVIVRDTPLYDMWISGKYSEHTVNEAVEWCSRILQFFESENIPVIRMGLNPTEDLSGGAAVGGAYHPAFGELVYSRLYLKRAERLLSGVIGAKRVTFLVNPGCVSFLAGHKKCNTDAIKREFGIKRVEIKSCGSVEKGDVQLVFVEK